MLTLNEQYSKKFQENGFLGEPIKMSNFMCNKGILHIKTLVKV